MASKREFRRVRRARWAVRSGLFMISIGVPTALSGVGAVVHDVPESWPGVAFGVALAGGGGASAWWAHRTVPTATSRDRADLRSAGLDDGLPMGAFREGDRVLLEPADLFLLLAVACGAVGLLFAVGGGLDSDVGWRIALAFSCAGFVPAALFCRLGTCIRYELSPTGIRRRTGLRRSVRWEDVQRIVPTSQGNPVAAHEEYDSIELQTALPVEGTWRWWTPVCFTINGKLLEIDGVALKSVVDAQVAGARSLEAAPSENVA